MSDEPPVNSPQTAGVRASDEDRDRLIAELNEHTVAGRLSTEEFEERTQAAYAARTLPELEQLRRDLPSTPTVQGIAETARRRHLTRRVIQETGGSAGLFVVCTLIWLASGAHGQFWPVWVLIVFAFSVVRNGWALFGPAPDLDAVESDLDTRRQRRLEDRQQRADQRRSRRGDRLKP